MSNSVEHKLSPGENYMRMLRGEIPEYVPIWTVGLPLSIDEPFPLAMMEPSLTSYHMAPGEDKTDIWGVTWVGSQDVNGAKLPKPNDFILDDICKWRDVIKAPDFSDVDWEQLVKDDLARAQVDRSVSAVAQGIFVGPFQTFVSFMGFTEAFIAMSEEPEEVKALLEYIMDFYCDIEKKYFEYLRPDAFELIDDTCSAKAPFFSVDMYREFYLPCYKRMAKLANDNGLPIQFHNCGMAAEFIEIGHEEFQIAAWDPAQTMNDLDAFQAKWGRDIAIVGAFDPSGDLLDPDCPDEIIRQAVRDLFDKRAGNGGYAFCGFIYGSIGDEKAHHKQMVLEQEVIDYGGQFYK